MAKIPTLTVTTEFGTFQRQTARTYTHIVIVKGYRAERLEASRVSTITDSRKTAALYRKGLDTTGRVAYGSQEQLNIWAAQYEAEAAALEARGPITADATTWGLTEANLTSTPTWAVIGWCGRLDLARKLAVGTEASRFRHVHVIEVATGKVVA